MFIINEKDKSFIKLLQREWKPLFDESNETSSLLFGITEVQPGNKNPSHIHENSEEVIYIL